MDSAALASQLEEISASTIPMIVNVFRVCEGENGYGYRPSRNRVLQEICWVKEVLERVRNDLKETPVEVTEETVPALVLYDAFFMVWDCFWSFFSYDGPFASVREKIYRSKAVIDAYL